MTTWFITGCSTGLGRALAQAVLKHGDNVVVTARDTNKLQDIVADYPATALALTLDVTDDEQVNSAVGAALAHFGNIDVLVNNAGYGYRSAVEEGDDGPVRQLFDTHFFGVVATIKAVLPGMRARKSGTIINLSSIAARLSPEGSGYYAAAKAAIEALTLSLRKEVEPLGITAIAIEPGPFRTDFAGRSLVQSEVPIADYVDTAGKRRKGNDTMDGTQSGDPDKAAAVIIEIVESGDGPFLVMLGNDAVDLFRQSQELVRADVDRFEKVSRSTDFDD